MSPALSPPPINTMSNTMNKTMNTISNTATNLSGAATSIAGLTANDATTQNNINNLQSNAVNRREFRNQTREALLDPLGKLSSSRTSSRTFLTIGVNNVSKKSVSKFVSVFAYCRTVYGTLHRQPETVSVNLRIFFKPIEFL